MKKRRLISPILVNEHRQIIDGQHRFLAQQELNLSVPFIVKKGYGEVETQILNTNSKNWSLADWERYYCNKGIDDYLVFKEFRKQYKFLTKLSYQGNSLIKCVDKKSYLRLIEDIYNFRNRSNTEPLRLF